MGGKRDLQGVRTKYAFRLHLRHQLARPGGLLTGSRAAAKVDRNLNPTGASLNKKSSLTLCAAAFSTCVAANPATAPRLSAQGLSGKFSGQNGVPLHEQSADSVVRTGFADGYLAGVADASEGKTWCDRGKVKVDEINSIVVAELRKLPPVEQGRSAAQQVLRVLSVKFPCK